MGKHGSRRRLPVGSGYCDRNFVVGHQLAKQLGPAEHRKAASYRLLIFLVILMDGRRVHDDLYSIFYIGSLLTDENFRAHRNQMICERRLLIIRTADGKMFVQ